MNDNPASDKVELSGKPPENGATPVDPPDDGNVLDFLQADASPEAGGIDLDIDLHEGPVPPGASNVHNLDLHQTVVPPGESDVAKIDLHEGMPPPGESVPIVISPIEAAAAEEFAAPIISESPAPIMQAESEVVIPASEVAPQFGEFPHAKPDEIPSGEIDLAATVIDAPDSPTELHSATAAEGHDLKLEDAAKEIEPKPEEKPELATDPAFLAAFAGDIDALQKQLFGLREKWLAANAKAGDHEQLADALRKFDHEAQELVGLVRTPTLAPAEELGDDAKPGAFDFGAAPATGGAPATTIAPRAPRGGDSGGMGFRDLAQIVFGGLLAIPATILILWWAFGRDPLDLARKLPPWLEWAAPEGMRPKPGPAAPNTGVNPNDKGNGNVVAKGENKNELVTPPVTPEKKPETKIEMPPDVPMTTDPELKVPGIDDVPPPIAFENPNKPKKPEKKPETKPEKNPEPPMMAEFGVTDAKLVAGSDLGAEIRAARDEFTKLQDAMTKGEEVAKPARGKFYLAFCKLGAAVTFIDPKAASRAERLGIIEGELRAVTDFPSLILKIGTFGPLALSRKHLDGVFLAGKIDSIKPEGKLFAIEMSLVGTDKKARVYMQKDPAAYHPVGSHALVLGALVHDPATKLRGFEGENAPVVWSAMIVKIEPEKVPPAAPPSDGS